MRLRAVAAPEAMFLTASIIPAAWLIYDVTRSPRRFRPLRTRIVHICCVECDAAREGGGGYSLVGARCLGVRGKGHA